MVIIGNWEVGMVIIGNWEVGMFLLALGGISYTLGGVIYIIKKPNLKYMNFHDLFHFFVLIGTALQFFAVYLYVL